MAQTPTGQAQAIDLTGLSEEAVQAVRAVIEALRQQGPTHAPTPPSPDEWGRLFDAYLREVAARADSCPEGFVLDDNRETIYEGRGK